MKKTMKRSWILAVLCSVAGAQVQIEKQDWEGGVPDGCTSITVGKLASADGSVITSHTCDSHRTQAWLNVKPAAQFPADSAMELVVRRKDDTQAMPAYRYEKTGEIPQVTETFGYINTAYPAINTRQLAIGESTFGGREELRSTLGLIDCQQLVHLMVQRCTTAREAIDMAGTLLKQYGWNDAGECLTLADTQEVWHLEIVGPGADKIGAIWAAQRVPDDHVSVNANGSRIRQIDLSDENFFMASDNVFAVAKENGWWNPETGPFQFCYAYAPEDRKSISCRRREWRVLSMVAPSLNLHPESENHPFSVKPDEKVTLEKLVHIFRDYYEGTPYDMTKNLTVADDDGQVIISPLANPHMPYDMNKLLKINGGWGWRGERTIARWYTMYATITQSRAWLPDEVGGVVWLAFDNVATSIYVPLYSSITDVAESFKAPGRIEGYNRECAWWAFNRLGTLAAQRWGDMHQDVDAVWHPWQKELFQLQEQFDARALELHEKDPALAREYLTGVAIEWGDKVVQKAWELGDFLWTKYDEKF